MKIRDKNEFEKNTSALIELLVKKHYCLMNVSNLGKYDEQIDIVIFNVLNQLKNTVDNILNEIED
jgi:hypothetical protein